MTEFVGQLWLLPSPTRELAFLVLAALVVGLFMTVAKLILILAFRRNQKPAQAYEGRTLGPYYIDDIRKAKEVWVAWHTATHVSTSAELKQNGVGHKITRMLLLSPDGSYLAIHARLMENLGKSDAKSDINRAEKRLTGEGVKEIRFVNGLMLSMVICDPTDDKKGWIRIEPWSPFLEAGSRPIFYLHAKQHPVAFKNLRDSYIKTWESLKKSTPDKEDSWEVKDAARRT